MMAVIMSPPKIMPEAALNITKSGLPERLTTILLKGKHEKNNHCFLPPVVTFPSICV